jgi:hypothetical protein
MSAADKKDPLAGPCVFFDLGSGAVNVVVAPGRRYAPALFEGMAFPLGNARRAWRSSVAAEVAPLRLVSRETGRDDAAASPLDRTAQPATLEMLVN